MMTHLTEEEAQRLVDGLLDRERRDACRAHAEDCPECALLVESYSALCDALGGLDLPPAPADFTNSVMSRIEAIEENEVWERRLALGILLVTASIAVGVFLVAGGNAWAPALSRVCGKLGEFVGTLSLGASVLGPIVRALRLEIALACTVLALPLLFALSRLVPRRAAALG